MVQQELWGTLCCFVWTRRQIGDPVGESQMGFFPGSFSRDSPVRSEWDSRIGVLFSEYHIVNFVKNWRILTF